jgi:hypothetical protein
LLRKSKKKKHSKFIPEKKIIKPEVVYYSQNHCNAAEKVFMLEYNKIFRNDQYTWRGLQIEYPSRNMNYSETWHYLDELENPLLFEEILYKMLDTMKKENIISWWKGEKENFDGIDTIVIKCKK